jgi:hypothetical protein
VLSIKYNTMRTEFIKRCMEGSAVNISRAMRGRKTPGHRSGLAAKLRSMAQARPEPIDRRVSRRLSVGCLPRQFGKFHLPSQRTPHASERVRARTIVFGKAQHNKLPPPTPVERQGANSNLVPGAAGC